MQKRGMDEVKVKVKPLMEFCKATLTFESVDEIL